MRFRYLPVFVFAASVAMAQARPGLTLSSPAFEDNAVMPPKYTQAVKDFVSPPLRWSDVPDGTVSFVLVTRDLNNPLDRTPAESLHWLAFNIPGTSRALPEGVPLGAHYGPTVIQLQTSHGGVGYYGPGAPAPGPYHHYSFELFALDTTLTLGPSATRGDVLHAMEGHILGKGVLIGRFHK